MAEHSVNMDHRILLNDTRIVARKSRRSDKISRKAMETGFHPNKVNINDGFSLSRPLKTPNSHPERTGENSHQEQDFYFMPSLFLAH
jgi:hypothetical protein